jgi:hypothetical protein
MNLRKKLKADCGFKFNKYFTAKGMIGAIFPSFLIANSLHGGINFDRLFEEVTV